MCWRLAIFNSNFDPTYMYIERDIYECIYIYTRAYITFSFCGGLRFTNSSFFGIEWFQFAYMRYMRIDGSFCCCWLAHTILLILHIEIHIHIYRFIYIYISHPEARSSSGHHPPTLLIFKSCYFSIFSFILSGWVRLIDSVCICMMSVCVCRCCHLCTIPPSRLLCVHYTFLPSTTRGNNISLFHFDGISHHENDDSFLHRT